MWRSAAPHRQFVFAQEKRQKCFLLLLVSPLGGRMRINMHIILNNSSMIPIYEQLMEQIKNEIISGGLKEGEVLPSVRTLSGELKISALTVKKAYDKLEEENFVSTVHGKGTFVTATDMELAAEARRHAVEEDFCHAVAKARTVGMSDEEIKELFAIIIEE